jgi:hypothetical protein
VKKITLIVAFLALVSATCKKGKVQTQTKSDLRITNSTPWTFYDCTIDPEGTLSNNPGPKAHNYGQVDINTSTNYKTFDKLYPYSWVRLTMNNQIYYLKPYDYVGETTLESGKYAYKLIYLPATDRLGLEFIKE